MKVYSVVKARVVRTYLVTDNYAPASVVVWYLRRILLFFVEAVANDAVFVLR